MSENDHKSNISRRRASAKEGSSRQYRENRSAIIKAAAKVFEEHGYERSSLQDIADAVQIDRSSLYYYFSSKEELLTNVVHRAVHDSVTAVEAIREEPAPSAEKIRRVISGLMQSYADNYPYLYVWVQEDVGRIIRNRPDQDTQLASMARRYRVAVEAIVEDGIADGTLSSFGDVRVTTFAIVGMVHWTHRWFQPDGPLAASEIADTFSNIVLQGTIIDERAELRRSASGILV